MYTFANGMREAGVEVDLLYLGQLGEPKALMKAWRIVRERAGGYDVVHAQFGSACALATLGAKIPKVLSLRGSDWYRYRESVTREYFHSIAATSMTRLSLARYDSVIVMSNRMKGEVSSMYPAIVPTVITDPVDFTRFVPRNRQEARGLLGYADDTSYWVLFTTLSAENPMKRAALARNAVAIARKKMGDIKLRVATGIPHDQMPDFVASCDAVLSTSVHEGWPNCVKEALACDLPFVATDVSDLHAIASTEPSCQICAPDAQAIAEGIERALKAPSAVLHHHIAHMDIEVSCSRLSRLYESLMR